MDQPTIVAIGVGVLVVIVVIAALVGGAVRRRRRAEASWPELGEALAPEQEAPPLPEAARAPAREAPEPARAPPVAGVVTRLGRGLDATRRFLAHRLASIASRERVDEEIWDLIEEALIEADVGVKSSSRIVGKLRSAGVTPANMKEALKQELVFILDRGNRDFRLSEDGPSVWLVAGVNGSGKTTTIAKLAHLLVAEGRSVALAAADTFRAAASEQLGDWADRLGVHMVRHAQGADPAAVVFDAVEYAKAKGIDVLIVDTAGRLHTKTNLMEELKKVRRVAARQAGEVVEVLLILDATVGQNGIAQARTFKEALDVTGVVLTKLDGTARGGIVVAVQQELEIPVKAVGVGESIEDLEKFDPVAFAETLLA